MSQRFRAMRKCAFLLVKAAAKRSSLIRDGRERHLTSGRSPHDLKPPRRGPSASHPAPVGGRMV